MTADGLDDLRREYEALYERSMIPRVDSCALYAQNAPFGDLPSVAATSSKSSGSYDWFDLDEVEVGGSIFRCAEVAWAPCIQVWTKTGSDSWDYYQCSPHWPAMCFVGGRYLDKLSSKDPSDYIARGGLGLALWSALSALEVVEKRLRDKRRSSARWIRPNSARKAGGAKGRRAVGRLRMH